MAAGESAWFRCFRPLCFSVEKRRISGKTVHFPSCGFSAKKRQISRKTVDFPGCGFSKLWIFHGKTSDFPKNGAFSRLWIFRGKTADFRENGAFSGLWIFHEKTTHFPKKRWILQGKTTFPVKIHRVKPKAGYSQRFTCFCAFSLSCRS